MKIVLLLTLINGSFLFSQDSLKLSASYIIIDSIFNMSALDSAESFEWTYDPSKMSLRNTLHLNDSSEFILENPFDYIDFIKIKKNAEGVPIYVCVRNKYLDEGVFDSLVLVEDSLYNYYRVNNKDSLKLLSKLAICQNGFEEFSPISIQDFSKNSDVDGRTEYFDSNNYFREYYELKEGLPASANKEEVHSKKVIDSSFTHYSYLNYLNMKLILEEKNIKYAEPNIMLVIVKNISASEYAKFLHLSHIHDVFTGMYSIYYPILLHYFPDLLDEMR